MLFVSDLIIGGCGGLVGGEGKGVKSIYNSEKSMVNENANLYTINKSKSGLKINK